MARCWSELRLLGEVVAKSLLSGIRTLVALSLSSCCLLVMSIFFELYLFHLIAILQVALREEGAVNVSVDVVRFAESILSLCWSC